MYIWPNEVNQKFHCRLCDEKDNSYRIPPSPHPPLPPKIEILADLGTLTFQLQNTPHPPRIPKIEI